MKDLPLGRTHDDYDDERHEMVGEGVAYSYLTKVTVQIYNFSGKASSKKRREYLPEFGEL